MNVVVSWLLGVCIALAFVSVLQASRRAARQYRKLVRSARAGFVGIPRRPYEAIGDRASWAVTVDGVDVVFLDGRSAVWESDKPRVWNAPVCLFPWRLRAAITAVRASEMRMLGVGS